MLLKRGLPRNMDRRSLCSDRPIGSPTIAFGAPEARSKKGKSVLREVHLPDLEHGRPPDWPRARNGEATARQGRLTSAEDIEKCATSTASRKVKRRSATGSARPMIERATSRCSLGFFSDQMAPIARNGADGERELVMARWALPGLPQFGGALITHILAVRSPALARLARRAKPRTSRRLRVSRVRRHEAAQDAQVANSP